MSQSSKNVITYGEISEDKISDGEISEEKIPDDEISEDKISDGEISEDKIPDDEMSGNSSIRNHSQNILILKRFVMGKIRTHSLLLQRHKP